MVIIPAVGRFYTGTVPSATFHFNALARATDTVLSYYAQPQMAFTEYPGAVFHQNDDAFIGWTPDGWKRVWTGVVRKRWYGGGASVLRVRGAYFVDTVTGLQVRVIADDRHFLILDAAGGSSTNYVYHIGSWTTRPLGGFVVVHIDIRGKNMPQDNTGQSYFRVREVSEYVAANGTVLHDFVAGVPSENQWNELPGAIDILRYYTNCPRAPFLGAVTDPGKNNSIIWRGEIEHRFRYLYYDIRISTPYPTGTVSTFLRIITGSGDLLFGLGSRSSTDFWPAPHQPDEGDAEYSHFTHRGLLDLQTLAAGTYRARVEYTLTDGATRCSVKLYTLYAYPSRNWRPAVWQNMPPFVRGTTISSANVKPIRDNLQYLLNTYAFQNHACPRCYVGKSGNFWFNRGLRHLHYYCWVADSERRTPQIGYFDGMQWQEVNLPFVANTWQVYDLDSISRLFPGTPYRVRDVDFAIEDLEP